MAVKTNTAAGTFYLAFKVTSLDDPEHEVCKGTTIMELIDDGKSPKDHLRDWNKFLNKQYNPEEYKVSIWWRPGE